MSNGTWELASEVKEEYLPIVKEFIEKVEETSEGDPLELNLTNTKLNPYTLQNLMEELGYTVDERSDNGWQLDFWIYMEKDGFKNLIIEGTGIIFELKLVERV